MTENTEIEDVKTPFWPHAVRIVDNIGNHHGRIKASVDALNEYLESEHKRELTECRVEGQQELPYLLLTSINEASSEHILFMNRITWAFEDDEIDETTCHYLDDDRSIVTCAECGDYSKDDLWPALHGLLEWERRLVWRVEKKAKLLRNYLLHVEKVTHELTDVGKWPEFRIVDGKIVEEVSND